MSMFYLYVHRLLLHDCDLKVIANPQSGPHHFLIQLGADTNRLLSSGSDPRKNIAHYYYLDPVLHHLFP